MHQRGRPDKICLYFDKSLDVTLRLFAAPGFALLWSKTKFCG